MSKTYINSSGRLVLEYDSPDSCFLALSFILTQSKRLIKNMPYMKLEKSVSGTKPTPIRLLNFQDYQGVVYLNVQELQTGKCYNLSWNLENDGDIWLWALSDFDTLLDLPK
jgi:hypothetical protein